MALFKNLLFNLIALIGVPAAFFITVEQGLKFAGIGAPQDFFTTLTISTGRTTTRITPPSSINFILPRLASRPSKTPSQRYRMTQPFESSFWAGRRRGAFQT